MKILKKFYLFSFLLISLLVFSGCSTTTALLEEITQSIPQSNVSGTIDNDLIDLNTIPAYSGSPFVEINNNIPYFSAEEVTTDSFEYYSDLDYLGRAGVAYACLGMDLMPTEGRESISSVKPTGWHSTTYDFVNGKNLYNRCHLIAFMLAGENANEKNLITGTRYMNVDGMLPFENLAANYVRTGGHVLYRVTPIYNGEDLVASGVLMEAYSVEDQGASVLFNVYCYNVQPGVNINYTNGDSSAAATDTQNSEVGSSQVTYILNTSSKKFHLPTCSGAARISDNNRMEYSGSREDLLIEYEPCQICNP